MPRNVLQDISQQDKKIAETLGINEVDIKKQDRFTKLKEGLGEEVKQARDLLDTITKEMKHKQLKLAPELVRSLELL